VSIITSCEQIARVDLHAELAVDRGAADTHALPASVALCIGAMIADFYG